MGEQANMITPDDIQKEAEALLIEGHKTPPAPAVTAVLSELLKDVSYINFGEIVNGRVNARLDEIREKLYVTGADGSIQENPETSKDESEALQKERDALNKQIKKITQKHYKIITIEKLMGLMKAKQWGLCHRQGFYYAYNGQYWVTIDAEVIKSFLKAVALKMGVPKFDAKDADFSRKLFEQFVSDAYLPEPERDGKKVLINLQNGTFEITPEGHKLKEFSLDDFITYQLPFNYEPEADAPLFKRFLAEVLPDQQSRAVLSEYFGWIFIKNLKLEKALILYGSGANGKSVIFDILTALLGPENVTSYPLKSLTDEQGYHRAKLSQTLVNYASEISGSLDVNMFKALISGEPVQARLPYKEPFMLTDYGKFIFNANELPVASEITRAFFRRFLILPFPVEIPPEQQDKKLADKIISRELPGVLNWILEGLQRLIKQGNFSPCLAADAAADQYRAESDTVKLFVDEYEYEKTAETGPEYQYQLKAVYTNYREYCSNDGYRNVSKGKFKKRLLAIGFIIDRTSKGLTLYAKKTAGEYEG